MDNVLTPAGMNERVRVKKLRYLISRGIHMKIESVKES